MTALLQHNMSLRFEAPGRVRKDKVFDVTVVLEAPAMDVLLDVEFEAPMTVEIEMLVGRKGGQAQCGWW